MKVAMVNHIIFLGKRSSLISRRSREWRPFATLAESYRFSPCFKFFIVAQIVKVFPLLCIYVIDLKSFVFGTLF
jgi:hypothetical protein